MNKKIIVFSFFIFIILIACLPENEESSELVVVNLWDSTSLAQNINNDDPLPKINVAVSTMISPKETLSYYSMLFEYISKKTNHRINFKQRKTYQEVNLLLRNNEVDLAFICSGAYVDEMKVSGIEILAVPVCNDTPYYQAYVIANISSDIKRFEDFSGKTFAFTDPLSNSGKLYAVLRLNEINATPESFFSSVMYTYAHDISMELVSKKIVDGATVDGLVYEYKSKFYPEQVKNLKIIEKSEFYGIPPIVVSAGIDKQLKEDLKNIILSLHEDPKGKQILDLLLIDKFIEGYDSSYNSIRKVKQKVENVR